MNKFILALLIFASVPFIHGAGDDQPTAAARKLVIVYKSNATQSIEFNSGSGTLMNIQSDFARVNTPPMNNPQAYDFSSPGNRQGRLVIDLKTVASVTITATK